MNGMIPSWYRRYHEWARAKSPRSQMVFIFSIVIFTTIVAQILIRVYDPQTLLRLFGCLILVLGPLATLDAWAGGILRGQRIAPWIRLVAISGASVIGGAYILLNF